MRNKKKLDKKWTIGIVVGIAVLFGIGLFSMMSTTGGENERATLYHTPTCPLCQNVKDYIEENGITGIMQKNISINQSAARELYNRLVRCGEDVSRGAPVPVLWAEEQCFVGEIEVINYFKSLNPENEQS